MHNPIDPNGALLSLLKINQGKARKPGEVLDLVLKALGLNVIERHFCKPTVLKIWERYAWADNPSGFLLEVSGFIAEAKNAWFAQAQRN